MSGVFLRTRSRRFGGESLEVEVAQDEHFVYMVEDALKALGRPADILVLEKPELHNGFAFMWKNQAGEDRKVILFDPLELDYLKDRLGADQTMIANAVSALFTLAHEIGHHVCNHLGDGIGSRPWKELRADQIAGAILSRSDWREFFGKQHQGRLRSDHESNVVRK